MCEALQVFVALMYRAGRFLDSHLDPEGSSAYVFKAEILRLRGGPELADSSGFGRFHQPDLCNFRHFHLVDLHVTVEKMFLTKILQSLWFDQGGSTSGHAVTDGAKGKRAPRVMRAQLQLLSVRRNVCPSGLPQHEYFPLTVCNMHTHTSSFACVC